MNDYAKNPSAIQELTPCQYQVTQPCATEPPLLNEFWDETRAGICANIVAGEPLFASIDTYDSNTGWPSFTVPLEPDVVVQVHDHTLGMVRTELRSAHGDNYLRHAFDDGPMAQGSLRYCINSAYLPSSTDCEVSHDLCA